MRKTAAIILASGDDARMKSRLAKALHPICGKPMARYIIDACKDAGAEERVIVIGRNADQVRAELGDDVRYALQDEGLSPGDACKGAAELPDGDWDVFLVRGDMPLLNSETLRRLKTTHSASGADATLLTAIVNDAGSHDRLLRAPFGAVRLLVTEKDASREQLEIREMSAEAYCFRLPVLRKYLDNLTPSDAQSEHFLVHIINSMAADGLTVGAFISAEPVIARKVNDRVDLAYVTGVVRQQILERLMLNGVTIIDPSSTYVDLNVEVGTDTVIYPQTILENGTRIGENCIIGPSARLSGAEMGSEVTVLFSNVVDSTVGDGSRIGPFANLRPGCRLGRKVKIGDFVEAKNAAIGDHVSAGHLTYIGDAAVGEHTNIGAGAITCNYDGYVKHQTIIGKNVFLGSNVTLVAPVTIGDGALIAAGSTITDDVPSDSLALARSRQTVKEDWARKRREQKTKRDLD